ncbi:hypothetical protein VHEMI07355 [[Torrubiella] hemipterigena]|uniref:Methyltransferase type 11 domain-containing protein n=1 Tax=[Torrubiella] hemipterigena TaxID=1531966 RepID=A0A0A1TL78_9HYPO|nr:hypothetical protein VHEMI07355 [[Torrubiella] hemipterigena]
MLPVKELKDNLFRPWFLMFWAFKLALRTIGRLIAAGDFATLFSPSALFDACFANFWGLLSPGFKDDMAPVVRPLYEGRLHDGKVVDKPVHPPVSGVVLELGAGNGSWIKEFAEIGNINTTGSDDKLRKRGGTGKPTISKIYAVEPVLQSVEVLRERIQEAGMEHVYEVVPVGVESINDPSKWDGKIEPESLDCIVTVFCLCSIPEPEKNIAALYALLKPGGRWYVYEHVRCHRSVFWIAIYQRKCPHSKAKTFSNHLSRLNRISLEVFGGLWACQPGRAAAS